MVNSVVVLSGGLDSRVALEVALNHSDRVHCLSFDYNQRHRRELMMAGAVCVDKGLPHKIINIEFLHDITSSSLTHSTETPFGHYEEESMRQTVVPGRNLIMISIAFSYAVHVQASKVFVGVHGGDHFIYKDCRKEFINSMQGVGNLFDDKRVRIEAPFIDMHKGEIVKLGSQMGVDFLQTHTCYEGETKPCGKCGSCVERAEAFEFAGVDDPLVT